MLTAKINVQPFRHVTAVLGGAMGFSRALANALSIYATGVSQAHVKVFDTMRPSSDGYAYRICSQITRMALARAHTGKRAHPDRRVRI